METNNIEDIFKILKIPYESLNNEYPTIYDIKTPYEQCGISINVPITINESIASTVEKK